MDLQRVHQVTLENTKLFLKMTCRIILLAITIMSIENLAIKDQWYKFATYQTAYHKK